MKILLKYGWEKVSNRDCLFVKPEKGLFLSVYVDDFRQAGKKQKTLTQFGKYERKTSIWDNQHHSLTTFIWVVLNENAKRAKILWTIPEKVCIQNLCGSKRKATLFRET